MITLALILGIALDSCDKTSKYRILLKSPIVSVTFNRHLSCANLILEGRNAFIIKIRIPEIKKIQAIIGF
jgi:hypothetical protein